MEMNYFQDLEDRALAEARAMFFGPALSPWLGTREQRVANELIKIRAERIERQTAQAASKAYALAVQRGMNSVAPVAPVVRIQSEVLEPASNRPVKPAPIIRNSTKARRDTLTPVIELAQSQCRNPIDTAEVWAVLLVLAEKKHPPLIGATEEGLQYYKGGEAAIFKRKSLGKRLTR